MRVGRTMTTISGTIPIRRDYAAFRAEEERGAPGNRGMGQRGAGSSITSTASGRWTGNWPCSRPKEGRGCCFDLPLGVHPRGFDVKRWPGLFATGISAGAPPDMFFASGQDWETPPLDPQNRPPRWLPLSCRLPAQPHAPRVGAQDRPHDVVPSLVLDTGGPEPERRRLCHLPGRGAVRRSLPGIPPASDGRGGRGSRHGPRRGPRRACAGHAVARTWILLGCSATPALETIAARHPAGRGGHARDARHGAAGRLSAW